MLPFFDWSLAPFMVSAPFVALTFFASRYSPFDFLRERLNGLANLTEEGHQLGLILYSISYTLLAGLFSSKPYVIGVGILPMAYGDSFAALVGEKLGKKGHRPVNEKSVEGSLVMFVVSFFSLLFSMFFFSCFYPFKAGEKIIPIFIVSLIATVTEFFSPQGFDNLTVPLAGASAFLVFEQWM